MSSCGLCYQYSKSGHVRQTRFEHPFYSLSNVLRYEIIYIWDCVVWRASTYNSLWCAGLSGIQSQELQRSASTTSGMMKCVELRHMLETDSAENLWFHSFMPHKDVGVLMFDDYWTTIESYRARHGQVLHGRITASLTLLYLAQIQMLLVLLRNVNVLVPVYPAKGFMLGLMSDWPSLLSCESRSTVEAWTPPTDSQFHHMRKVTPPSARIKQNHRNHTTQEWDHLSTKQL